MLRSSSLIFSLSLIFSSSIAFANVKQEALAPEHPSVTTEVVPEVQAAQTTAASNVKSAEPVVVPTAPIVIAEKTTVAPAAVPATAVEMSAKPAVTNNAQTAKEPIQPVVNTNAPRTAPKMAAKTKAVEVVAPVAAEVKKPIVDRQKSDTTTAVTADKQISSDKQAASEKQVTSDKQTASDKHASSEKPVTMHQSTESTNAVKPEVAEKQASMDLEVVDFVLAGKVEAREPQGVVEAFGKENEYGFAFARLHAKAATEVTFVWYRNDKQVASFKQPIQASKKWRTYSSVKLRPGQWKVQLLTEDKVMAEKTFTIE